MKPQSIMLCGGAPLYLLRKEYTMITDKTLTKFGLTKDVGNTKLKEVLKCGTKLKEIHIDIYPENPLISSATPFALLLRTIEKNAIVGNDEDRLILKGNDAYQTYFVNVLYSKITECFYKTSEYCSEFILNVQNIYYRITILN